MIKIIFTIGLCLLCACHPNKTNKIINLPKADKIREMVRIDNPFAYVLDPEEAIKNITISDSVISGKPYLSEEKFIPLDSKNGPIGLISKILFYKDRIYIADNRKSQAVFIYDTLGNSVRKIDERGKGPKEYYGLGDICIDTLNEELILDDRLTQRRLYYDLDGDFLRTEETKINILNMVITNKSFIYRSSFGQNWQIKELVDYSLYSGINDTIRYRGFKFFPFEKCDYNSSFINSNDNGKVYYQPGFSDTIYSILSDSSFCVAAYVKLKKSMFQKLYNSDKGSNDIVEKFYREGYQYLNNLFFYEIDNCIFYGCVLDESQRISFYLYDKTNKISYKFNDGVYFGGLAARKAFKYPITTFNNYFVGSVEANDLFSAKQLLDKYHHKSENPRLANIMSKITEKDNPVLILYRFTFAK
jgi:hypothetical protein